MVRVISNVISNCQGTSRHQKYHAMRSRSASLIGMFTGLAVLSFATLGIMVSSDWEPLCYRAVTESPSLNSGFRREATFKFLDGQWKNNTLFEALKKLPPQDQHRFITSKLNDDDLSGHNCELLIEQLALIDIELTREFILHCLSPSQPLEKRRRAATCSTIAGEGWSKDILVKIAVDENEDSFLRRKALKTVGISNIPVHQSIEKLLTDEDIILRKISGKYLLALAKGNESLQLKVFGALRCQDLQWVEKEGKTSLSSEEMEKIVIRIARLNKLDPFLVMAVIKAESNFDPLCVSRAGAQGLMQLMPRTAESVGVDDPFDIRQNILGGVTYLKKMMDRFENNVPLALAAYNAGPTTVARYKGVPPYKETKNYIKKVFRFIENYKKRGVVTLPRS